MTVQKTGTPGIGSHIAIFVPSLRGGGAERIMVTLANGFSALGHRVDLVLAKAEGPYLSEVSNDVRIVDLGKGRVLACLLPLMNYLRREQPQVMMSAMNYANVVAVLAGKLARVQTRLVVSEHSSLSHRPKGMNASIIRGLMRLLYRTADSVVCTSKGMERDMPLVLGVREEKAFTIYNPVDIEAVTQQMNEPLDHAWLAEGSAPVILAVGRLAEIKDYPTLLHAFAGLRRDRKVRLIILGQGEEDERLKSLSSDLGIAADVFFAGFQSNPFAWMARCDLLVLSSTKEAFGNVLTEAMVCGLPIVSSDCPSGPKEILEGGRWGRLVPVGDARALKCAMNETLDDTAKPDYTLALQRFEKDKIISQYLDVLLRKITRHL